MNRTQAIKYVAICVDNAQSPRKVSEMPANARLIGWQCGFEPMFVAVWSYLGDRLEDDEAEEIAIDYLSEIGWFSNGSQHYPDFVI